jgi:hypothetical protein
MRMQRDRIPFLWCTWFVDANTRGELSMSLSSHIEELKKKHQALSDQVEVAQRSPGASDFEIAELKKHKLRLKEEIEKLSVSA